MAEHAVGYGLFQVHEFDEVAQLAPRVEQCVLDLSKFSSLVKLEAFCPFISAHNALDNMNCITEGVLHENLQTLLCTYLPTSDKKLAVVLGVSDPKIAAAVSELLPVKCSCGGVVTELMRGIRLHFPHLVRHSKMSTSAASKAQLGLGHSYSRAKVKFNVNRQDNMIIQSTALLDQLDKNINTFAMRMKEWYSYHYPEMKKIIPDNQQFSDAMSIVRDRTSLTEEAAAELESVLEDSNKTKAVIESAKTSMGMDINSTDLDNVIAFSSIVDGLTSMRKRLAEYQRGRMEAIAPNLAVLVGQQVGARLISHAGSLTNLAKYPASTVQILGAEKALFRCIMKDVFTGKMSGDVQVRALKTKGNTPKYGLIFNCSQISRAGTKNKGRISRYLANKCSIASRIDCFSDHPTSVFGEHLWQQVEDRLKFFDSGELPAKNEDVMKQAMCQTVAERNRIAKKEKKRLKRERRAERALLESSAGEESVGHVDDAVLVSNEVPRIKKNKKKKKDKDGERRLSERLSESGDAGYTSSEVMSEMAENGDSCGGDYGGTMVTARKKKKKKRVKDGEETSCAELLESGEGDTSVESTPRKDKRKRDKKVMENNCLEPVEGSECQMDVDCKAKKGKDKGGREGVGGKIPESIDSDSFTERRHKKKKKKDHSILDAAVTVDVGGDAGSSVRKGRKRHRDSFSEGLSDNVDVNGNSVPEKKKRRLAEGLQGKEAQKKN